MSKHDIKKQLIACIEKTDDEELLSLMKEDFVFYRNMQDADITGSLTDEQLKELKTISDEAEEQDIHTLEEFKMATQQWRTR